MRRIFPKLYVVLATLFLVACSGTEEPQTQQPGSNSEQIYQHTIVSFGTLIDVSIYGVSEKKAEAAFDALERDFQYMQTTWHPWQLSALLRTNQLLATGERFSVAPSILPLVKQSIILTRKSDGLFDPAIGKLIKLWSFQNGETPDEPPPADTIKKLVKSHPSMLDIKVDGITLQSSNRDVLMDFGGFAKGYGIDKAINLLRSRGIQNAVVNAGGDLRAIGKPGNRNWKIGIRDPRKQGAIASVEVSGDESVFTSGDYERYFMYKGKRYHHIIDPRTGYPATGSMSATVLYDGDGGTADAAATALFVAGPKDWRRIAHSMGISMVMLIASDGTIYMTPEMQKRVTFMQKPQKLVIREPLQ